MTGPIRAIETRYAGCRFRSRTEARFAVFLDALGMEWEYEAQGFHTPDGPYLPDFTLKHPEGLSLKPAYVEIKGADPTDSDLNRARHIENLGVLVGGLPRDPEKIKWWVYRNGSWAMYFGVPPGLKTFTDDQIRNALTEARSARFEHGETGRS